MSARISVLGSSSSGNGYIIHTDKESLVLEAGVPFKDVLDAVGYSLPCIKGILVSHKHQDHAKYIRQYQNYQIPVYSCKEVCDVYKGVKCLEHTKRYKIGGFSVMPLTVPHNADNFAYVIDHEEFGRIVFATDLQTFNYRIKRIDHFMIEANYSEDIIIDAMCDGAEIRSRSEYHMEIDKTIMAIENNASESLKNIILIHLSDGLSNADDFRKRVIDKFHVPTFVADSGMEIDISKYDF